MSVTFHCPEAPLKTVPCRWCGEGGEWVTDPDMLTRDGRCDPFCDGTSRESEAPEVNFANANAAGILQMLGLYDPEGPWGELSVEEIPAILQRVLVALNDTGRRVHLIEGSSDQRAHEPRMVMGENGLPTISTGCRVVYGGNTDEQTVRRLESVQDLLVYAVENNYEVTWG